MSDTAEVACPACWETVEIDFDLSEGSQVFVYDCPVCCAPMTVRLRVSVDGELEDLGVSGDDE
jgi:hypothetical protein